MIELEHCTPACTGEWEQKPGLRWCCSVCPAFYGRAPDVNEAARIENSMGTLLKVLAAMGQRTRERGEEPPKRGFG